MTWNRNCPADGVDALLEHHQVHPALLELGGEFGHVPHRPERSREVIATLQRNLATEPEAHFALSMHFPARWDPFFTDVMTLVIR
ncbi:hypothetical protein [Nocardia barduliensis]|uniref:hypothetical protein n=1 Tax=Nocardia barduliensis TaxID=2736643 RepID=UPI001573A3BD|nr:hypothetical protein [Nocardia barduliensis]